MSPGAYIAVLLKGVNSIESPSTHEEVMKIFNEVVRVLLMSETGAPHSFQFDGMYQCASYNF